MKDARSRWWEQGKGTKMLVLVPHGSIISRWPARNVCWYRHAVYSLGDMRYGRGDGDSLPNWDIACGRFSLV